jgi:diadenosine tetraphosphate (Ap4A) HIT family hydrolase
MFEIDRKLKADTFEVCNLKFSKVLLMNDITYPWLILVPQKENVTELTDLSREDQHILMSEIAQVSDVLKSITAADKMNIATLGNVVPQLHVHVIARFKNDAAWPAPVWGKSPAIVYGERIKEEFVRTLCEKLL